MLNKQKLDWQSGKIFHDSINKLNKNYNKSEAVCLSVLALTLTPQFASSNH